MSLILISNDDGIDSLGLQSLVREMSGVAELVVVAPDRERSAVSHGLTIHEPLTLRKLAEGRYSLDGTPADCIIYAIRHVVERKPDLVISGINHGANLGDDLFYSGTVAAAREALRHGVSSIAASQAYDDSPIRFEEAASFTRDLAKRLLESKDGERICLNVNFPVKASLGTRVTRQGVNVRYPHFNSLDRSEGRPALIDDRKNTPSEIPFDYEAILRNYVSITPLQRDQTDYAAIAALKVLIQTGN